jgi:hypothetical protein
MAKKSEPAKREKWGAEYLNAKMVVQIAGPITDTALTAVASPGAIAPSNLVQSLKVRALNANYGLGVASSLVQRWGDKKIGQAAALSRGSVTAILSEAVPVLQTLTRARGTGLKGWNGAYVAATSGYNPSAISFAGADVSPYALTKYGLGIARKIVNRTRIAEPVKNGLSLLGASL